MADETKEADAVGADKKSGLLRTLMIPLVVGVVCAGLGFAIPMAFPSLLGVESDPVEAPPPAPSFVQFGDVVVNLNEGRMNRYLRLKITLQVAVPPEEIPQIEQEVTKHKAILTSWLLGYLADMSMEDIRGAAGQNRLRREIHDQFNLVMFPDTEGEIKDVLFEEFNVQ
jgi:flagellar basal body-associated protein FliL